MKIALVSCCKSKLDHNAEAQLIYTGDLFRKTKSYAEQNYDGWLILSALLGVVHPKEIIEPYEYTLIGKTQNVKREWAKKVFVELSIHPSDTEFYVFAGADYRQYLVPLLENAGYKVTVPLQGLGIGQQKAWLKKALVDG
ncbi:hypothetical protein KQI74_28090 [Paenibacillus barcinonensis]|uniref:DUF6884 domain-containing protein n=1 Tax=Paenibacillus barcinonensis TaxID=198119 RepID=UPI001C0FF181|nr:DUF6884 domain-containing protein [Paenibacillus barcinonensis]MBU5356117.1 hypothetical protein [Paenibacillus barcinonensis]